MAIPFQVLVAKDVLPFLNNRGSPLPLCWGMMFFFDSRTSLSLAVQFDPFFLAFWVDRVTHVFTATVQESFVYSLRMRSFKFTSLSAVGFSFPCAFPLYVPPLCLRTGRYYDLT